MARRCKHKLERHLELPRVLRCLRCAEHCETICSVCKKPVCLRHNAASRYSFEVICLDCFLVCSGAVAPSSSREAS